MSDRPIRVLCVDDHALLVQGMRTRLSMETDLEFVGWLDTAENLVEQARQNEADIVLLDIEMPGPDPLEVMRDLHRQLPQVRTIILSAFIRDRYIDAALTAGAWGYLSKSDDPAEVMEAIRTVAGGEFAFGPTVLERCRVTDERPEQPAEPERPASRLDQLTPREFQILRMIGQGLSRTEIAEAIHRSPKTVDNHRAAIMEKLGIRDRVELVRYAIGEGLAEL